MFVRVSFCVFVASVIVVKCSVIVHVYSWICYDLFIEGLVLGRALLQHGAVVVAVEREGSEIVSELVASECESRLFTEFGFMLFSDKT